MPSRLQHSLRFAFPQVVAILVVALAYELVEAIALGAVPRGSTPAGAVAANMAVWTVIATVVGAVTFLLRLSDAITRVPGWGFAWLEAAWIAFACVVVARAIEVGSIERAVVIGAGAVGAWLLVHRFIPGWPGSPRTDEAGEGGPGSRRNLP